MIAGNFVDGNSGSGASEKGSDLLKSPQSRQSSRKGFHFFMNPKFCYNGDNEAINNHQLTVIISQ